MTHYISAQLETYHFLNHFRKRPGKLRACLVLTVVAYACYIVGSSPHGGSGLEVTYLKKVFEWSDGDEFNDWYAEVK